MEVGFGPSGAYHLSRKENLWAGNVVGKGTLWQAERYNKVQVLVQTPFRHLKVVQLIRLRKRTSSRPKIDGDRSQLITLLGDLSNDRTLFVGET